MSLRAPFLPLVALCVALLLWVIPGALADGGSTEVPAKKAVTLHEGHVFYLHRGEGNPAVAEDAERDAGEAHWQGGGADRS